MSLEFAYSFRQNAAQPGLRDLDRVVLTAAVVSDEGVSIAPGAEGTVVSVDAESGTYVVEFSKPLGSLATVEPHDVRLLEHAPL